MNLTRRRFLVFGLPAITLTVAACDSSAKTEKESDMKPPPPTPLKGREAPVAK
jgi:hypothetical protein